MGQPLNRIHISNTKNIQHVILTYLFIYKSITYKYIKLYKYSYNNNQRKEAINFRVIEEGHGEAEMRECGRGLREEREGGKGYNYILITKGKILSSIKNCIFCEFFNRNIQRKTQKTHFQESIALS